MSERPDLRPYLGQRVHVRVDRPLGSTHPRDSSFLYPINYGYLPGSRGGDGEPIDAYILGVDGPRHEFEGLVIAIVLRHDDVEDKLVVAPPGQQYAAEEIAAQLHFQEQYFTTSLLLA